MLYLLDQLYSEVQFMENTNDPTLKIYTRMEVLWRACTLGHLDCIRNASKAFQDWRFAINPDRENA